MEAGYLNDEFNRALYKNSTNLPSDIAQAELR